MARSRKKLNHSLAESQVSVGRKGKKKLYFLLFIIMFSQGLVLYFLFFPETIQILTQKITGNKQDWNIWENKGLHSLKMGKLYQAIYFFEKALRKIPEHHPNKELIAKRLSYLYDEISKDPKLEKKKVLPANIKVKQLPYLFDAAERAYAKSNYLQARGLYYQFLAQADAGENYKKLFAQANYRAQQCLMLHMLKQQKKHENKEDPLISQALHIIKD